MAMNCFDNLLQKGFDDQCVKPTVLGVGGSPRKNRNSDVLLKHIFKGAKGKEITCEKVQYSILSG
jgi:hypothetical protein